MIYSLNKTAPRYCIEIQNTTTCRTCGHYFMAMFTWIIVIVTGGFILIETQGKLNKIKCYLNTAISS